MEINGAGIDVANIRLKGKLYCISKSLLISVKEQANLAMEIRDIVRGIIP